MSPKRNAHKFCAQRRWLEVYDECRLAKHCRCIAAQCVFVVLARQQLVVSPIESWRCKNLQLGSRNRIPTSLRVESCKALDVSIFEPYMEENNVFENKNKYLFLGNLKTLFETFKKDKPTSLTVVVNDGICKGCKYGKSVKMFSVNGSDSVKYKDRFAFVIEKENDILKDIFRCNLFCNERKPLFTVLLHKNG